MPRIIFCILLVCTSLFSYSSHVTGGNVSYECVGPNQFLISVTIYEDCASGFITPTDITIQASNDCGIPGLTSAVLTNVVYQNQFAPLCPADLANSTCNGGTLPGMYEHIWQGVVTLPADCNAWHFSYATCCRNASNNLTAGNTESYFWEATINSTTAPCNNSSTSSDQIRYICANELNIIEMLPNDIDGDSLNLTLINAPTNAAGTTVGYAIPYSGASPLVGITIDNETGTIQVTPTTLGNFVVNVLIEEYNENDSLTGTRIIDMQFYVVNCAGNNAPFFDSILNVSVATQTSSLALSACNGDNICFTVHSTDTNATDSIFMNPDLSALPGATFVQTSYIGIGTGDICWSIPGGISGSLPIPIYFQDNACPFNASGSQIIQLNVASSLDLGSDQALCNGQSAILTGFSDSTYWQANSGPALVVGGNISCNPCQSPVFTPADTTVIIATDATPGLCESADTITFYSSPSFTPVFSISPDSICLAEQSTITVSITPSGLYTYSWFNSGNLNNYASDSVVFTGNSSGSQTEFVSITSPEGCVDSYNANIYVSAGFSPVSTITASTGTYVCGQTLTLSAAGGSSSTQSDDFDSGSTNSFLWASTPNGTVNADCGTSSGPFALHFDNVGARNATTNMLNLTTCTSIDYCLLIGNAGSGGAPCENADAGEDVLLEYSTDGGASWVTITLHNQADWDVSQAWVCFNTSVPPGAFGPSTILRWSQPAFSPCAGCDNWSLDQVSIVCSGSLSYSWTPSAGLSNPTGDTTNLLIPTDSTTYSVHIVDPASGCDYTATIDIVPACDSCQTPVASTLSNLACNGDSDGQIEVNLFGPDGPFTVLIEDSLGNLIDSVVGVSSDTLFSGLSAGAYTITSISSSGCSNDTTGIITEPAAPLTTSGFGDTTLCEGEEFSYSGTTSGGTGSITYFWSTGDTGVGPFLDTATVSNIIILTASDQNSCGAKDSIIITVNPLPVVAFGAVASDTVCSTSGFVILPVSTPAGGTFSGTSITGNIFDPAIAGPGNHLIIYSFTTAAGCSASDSLIITVENCNGILEHDIQSVVVFPNPFNTHIDISTNQNMTHICVYDLTGKLMENLDLKAMSHRINLSDQSPGNYFVEITLMDGYVVRKKLVKS
ncbi:MAG: hypothetical protein ACI9J3_002959 [Parvicellaceae bacterium]|jgi:hypothetical protein